MKYSKYIAIALAALTIVGSVPTALAQPLMIIGGSSNDSSTAAEEQDGQSIYEKLQNKQITCDKLSDDNFDVLGDFFMGRMMGGNHAAMNQYMQNRLGEAGEKQVHITMGKRLSGCNANASYPDAINTDSSLAWMGGMMGGAGNGWNMMNGYAGSSWLWAGMTLLLLVVVLGLIGVIVWLYRSKTARPNAKKKPKA